MLQACKYSFSSFHQHCPREQGFHESLQQRRREIKNLGQNKEYKYFISSCHKVSTDSYGSSFNRLRERKVLGQTFCGESGADEFVLQPKVDQIVTPPSNLWKKVDVFYRFCRLHSVIGTIIGVTSVSLLPLNSIGDLSPAFLVGILKALIPMAFVNIYVTCLNQLTDVEIDKVNKPHYVLASGEYSMGQGKAITSAFLLAGFLMVIMFKSPPLFVGFLLYFFFGTAYSAELPLLRWKKNPFLSALCMIHFGGLIIPFAVFYHIQIYVLGRPAIFTRPLGFTVFFCSLFTVVLALFKDIPDVDGDKAFGIQTFSITYGKEKVFRFCISLLLIIYGCAMVMGAFSSSLLGKLATVIGHLILGSILWTSANSLNLDDNSSVESYYMFLWKLFYAEYLLIHYVR